mmetsp:Transcript_12931/g.29770  ORF Transcript_12931/g.29770 Transcript_12931/m.29770 type:complete len:363 (-) Transcript_12931:302-1390(-)
MLKGPSKKVLMSRGSVLDNRYQCIESLGAGSSAQVWLVYDLKHKQTVAIKMFEIWEGMVTQSQREIDILQHIEEHSNCRSDVTRLLRTFSHQDRLCLVFPFVAGSTLRDVLNNNGKKGFEVGIIYHVVKQLLETLNFLSSSPVETLHGDIKPENIMSTSGTRTVLLDFGLSFKVSEVKQGLYIQSRWYRAPEVLLGVPPTAMVDIWSFGCVLLELLGGRPPFTGVDSLDQLRQETDACGLPTQDMLKRCSPHTNEVVSALEPEIKQKWAKRGVEVTNNAPPIPYFANCVLGDRPSHPSVTPSHREMFLDLAWHCLRIDPAARCTAAWALDHKVFNMTDPPMFLPKERSISSAMGSLGVSGKR